VRMRIIDCVDTSKVNADARRHFPSYLACKVTLPGHSGENPTPALNIAPVWCSLLSLQVEGFVSHSPST
jgi:hypothetical protein